MPRRHVPRVTLPRGLLPDAAELPSEPASLRGVGMVVVPAAAARMSVIYFEAAQGIS